MLSKSKIISFVPTKNPTRARQFYQETLELTLISEDPFAIVYNANGVMLRVAKVPKLRPAGYTVLGWDVRDIRAEIKRLAKKGVKFERFSFLPQDALGIWKAPSGAKVAWFKDPDGNILSISEHPERSTP